MPDVLTPTTGDSRESGTGQRPPFDEGVRIETVVSGLARFAEGPLWWPDKGCLVVSDIVSDCSWLVWPDGRAEVFRQPSEHANGRGWGLDGHMLTAEHVTRQVSRLADGAYLPLSTTYDGKRYNSPNDVIVASWGEAFITDPPFGLAPPYGSRQQTAELAFSGVYAINLSTGASRLIHDGFKYPNGLCLSPDETRLYVNDSATGDISVFDAGPGRVDNCRLFASASFAPDTGVVDGLKCDAEGRVYCTAPGKSVAIFAASGALLSRLIFPEQPSAIAFGDADYGTLYVTAETGVYRIRTRTRGVGSSVRGVPV